MLVDTQRRNLRRFSFTLVLGLLLGGLLTKLAEWFLPDSAARDFLATSVEASIGPFSLDLVAVAFTIGPLAVKLNVLTLVGIAIVAFIVRSWI
ncbi:MAG: DUF4321 domain-containing protein [Gemmatimonadetes bacterium]|nr:MAG: DUF4321 domain-containing protein [Gemmatimonadota bacterium]